jgi:hypothetical protein|tara:strand:+ start:1249 stop:1575 length:327 start_codon:yes stop_codon:yes gene_type:complete
MKVWVMQASYEGELFSSVHLTQKGCALACISDITEFLDISDEESALNVRERIGEEEDGAEPIEWDQEKLKEMTSEELWKIFAEWCNMSWDMMADRSYSLDGKCVEIEA